MNFVRSKYPEADMYAMGFSLGANILTKYLGEEGEKCYLKGVTCVSNPWNFLILATEIEICLGSTTISFLTNLWRDIWVMTMPLTKLWVCRKSRGMRRHLRNSIWCLLSEFTDTQLWNSTIKRLVRSIMYQILKFQLSSSILLTTLYAATKRYLMKNLSPITTRFF